MEIKKIAGDSFQTEVTEAGVPVLLDFYADWCGPCKAQLPVLEQAAEEACDVKFCKVNVDEEPRLADIPENHRISSAGRDPGIPGDVKEWKKRLR